MRIGDQPKKPAGGVPREGRFRVLHARGGFDRESPFPFRRPA